MKRSVFIILCLEGAVLSFNVAASAALVPSISVDFGISQFSTARIIWFYMLPYGISALVYGPLSRAYDPRNIEIVCLALFSAANLLAAVSSDITVLLLARSLMGVFGASVIPLALILIASGVSGRKKGRAVGIFFGSTFAASLAGLFLSGMLHWRMIFLIPACCGLALWVAVLNFFPGSAKDPFSRRSNYLAVLRDVTVVKVFAYIFAVSLLYHGVQQWLAVYFSSRFNLGQFAISSLVTLTSLSGIFGEVFGGWLSDRLGRDKTVNLGLFLMTVSVFALLFRSTPAVLGLIMVVWGLGWTFNHAGISTILTFLPKEFLNESASLNSSLRFVSGGLGAMAAGLLMQKSFILGFSIMGTCLVILMLCAHKMIIRN